MLKRLRIVNVKIYSIRKGNRVYEMKTNHAAFAERIACFITSTPK